MGHISERLFNEHYDKLILGGDFFEHGDYYIRERKRYRRTLEAILDAIGDRNPSAMEVLEIGGGQMALLLRAMFGCKAVIADVNPNYSGKLVMDGLEFRVCDLLHDDLADRDRFDLVVMCEVIEHMPVPPYTVLEKISKWMRSSGILFLTTPNVYRLRNVVRLAMGLRVFDYFFIPEKGQMIGHPIEYAPEHLKWQLERAGFRGARVLHRQLVLTGATLAARIARLLLSPLLIRPMFRDTLVAVAYKAP